MSAHDVKLFGDQIAASRLETRFAQLKATSLLRLAIERAMDSELSHIVPEVES